MSSSLRLKNSTDQEFSITHQDNAGSIAIDSSQIVSNKDGVVMLASLPTSDPLVAGQLWNNSGVLTVSSGV